MVKIDLSKNWTIYSALPTMPAAEELAAYWGMLREQAGLNLGQPKIAEIGTTKLSAPGIILKASANLTTKSGQSANADKRGFSWQFENDKIEISGDSMRGLWNGIYDLLASIGIKWPNPGQEGLPQPQEDGAKMIFTLKSERANTPVNSSAQERKRFFVDTQTSPKERIKIVKWAAKNKYDALVFSLGDKFFTGGHGAEFVKIAKHYDLFFEAGGCDFSLLVPRKLFAFHHDLFRMEEGKRKKNHHFCPTNPKTTARIKNNAQVLFKRAMAHMTVPRVFHLLPDEDHEDTWCACPACRAFSPYEQNLIAVNSSADALAKLDPNARLSFFDYGVEQEVKESSMQGISQRKNTFRLSVR